MMLAVQDFIGAQEIGALLGVSRQRVQQLIKMDDWPEPVAELAMGKVWNRTDITAWARGHGRIVAGAPPADAV